MLSGMVWQAAVAASSGDEGHCSSFPLTLTGGLLPATAAGRGDAVLVRESLLEMREEFPSLEPLPDTMIRFPVLSKIYPRSTDSDGPYTIYLFFVLLFFDLLRAAFGHVWDKGGDGDHLGGNTVHHFCCCEPNRSR